MSHGGDLFDLDRGDPSEPLFDLAWRGYAKSQVDKELARADAIVAAITAERDEAYAQIQLLAGQVHQLQMQLADMRRKTAADATVSFRHLGPRVEQILTLAEEQAEAIHAGAIQDIAAQRAEAERILTEARAQSQLHHPCVMPVLDVQTANRDKRIWAVARGGDLKVKDANLPPVETLESNKIDVNPFLGGEEAIQHMTLAKGCKANLFASEEQFPELAKPVHGLSHDGDVLP